MKKRKCHAIISDRWPLNDYHRLGEVWRSKSDGIVVAIAGRYGWSLRRGKGNYVATTILDPDGLWSGWVSIRAHEIDDSDEWERLA